MKKWFSAAVTPQGPSIDILRWRGSKFVLGYPVAMSFSWFCSQKRGVTGPVRGFVCHFPWWSVWSSMQIVSKADYSFSGRSSCEWCSVSHHGYVHYLLGTDSFFRRNCVFLGSHFSKGLWLRFKNAWWRTYIHFTYMYKQPSREYWKDQVRRLWIYWQPASTCSPTQTSLTFAQLDTFLLKRPPSSTMMLASNLTH